MDYSTISQIGEGGFGIVEEVEDTNGDRLALKRFKDPQVPDIDADVFRKRFEREVVYQSKFNHPNIVKIVDYDLSADPPFCVMELADGSLLQELQADHTLGGSPNQALFDILAGLEHIHSLAIAHRDLKPGNILRFDEPNGTKRYAISDFGLMTAAESQSTTLTQSNFGMGTVLYAPPECVSNFKRATPLSDFYSFGAILHDIFVGPQRIPYSELTAAGPIGPIIERCTKSLPLRRYQSVADLREDLYEALNQEALTYSSDEEADIIALLQSDEELNDDEWDRVFLLIEDYQDKELSLSNVFRFISKDHIIFLSENAPELLTALGRGYCAYVQNSAFDFDYCDVLGSRLSQFFNYGNIELKALSMIALLEMGTGHNRWFVERIFMGLAGSELPEEVADRFQIEVEVQDLDFEYLVSRLERSISASREDLHNTLLAML